MPITPQNIFKTLWFSDIEGIAQVLWDIAVLYAKDRSEEVVAAYYRALQALAEQIEKAPESVLCQDFVHTYLEYWDKVG